MPEDDLPKYNTYMKRLYAFAKAMRMTIKIKEAEDAYIPSQRKIILDSDNSESAMVACLLHELGHMIDETLVNKIHNYELGVAYTKIYTKKSTRRQKELVLNCEEAAWRAAKHLAKQLDIPLGKWFNKARRYCLIDYRKMED